MADRRPIAVFDSGIGGITAVREIMEILPGEDIIYFGDTARVPYGTRSAATIRRYTMQNIRFLRGFEVKAFLVACGTMSNVIDAEMESFCGCPLAGVIESASRRAAAATENKRVGLIATPATIAFGRYRERIGEIDPSCEVFSQACPLFVPLVENGRINPGDVVTETVAEEYLTPLKIAGVDTLILGCTHYPLIEGIISKIMGGGVKIINSGKEAALSIKEKIELSDRVSGGKVSYYVSDGAENFSSVASMFLGRTIDGSVKEIDIEQY